MLCRSVLPLSTLPNRNPILKCSHLFTLSSPEAQPLESNSQVLLLTSPSLYFTEILPLRDPDLSVRPCYMLCSCLPDLNILQSNFWYRHTMSYGWVGWTLFPSMTTLMKLHCVSCQQSPPLALMATLSEKWLSVILHSTLADASF